MALATYILFAFMLLVGKFISVSQKPHHRRVPISVNYHFSRKCNKTCGFCFHTATTSHVEELAKAKQGLKLLKDAGMQKVNFAGGEPFLYPKFLGEMIDFCKEILQLESLSIVSNGSLIKEAFLRKHCQNIDILAVSCDSFDEATNIAIGRGSGDQVTKLYDIAIWCQKYNIKFKINTVVNKLNYMEDMNKHINELQPFRWKCFQVLIIEGENSSASTLRDGRKFTITTEQFNDFCERHNDQKSLVPEPNHLMADSYLILDEYMRFLDPNGKQPSQSILEVGVDQALKSVFWDGAAFLRRGGIYDWKKDTHNMARNELEW